MLSVFRLSALPARRRRTTTFHETPLASAARCHCQWHSTLAASHCGGIAAVPAARRADPSLATSSCSAQVLSRHSCPTAALLADTSDSALVTLPYCLAEVQEKVRAHLRSLLAQRLLAPLLTESLADLFGDQDGEGSSNTHLDRSGDAAAMNSAVVHSVTQSLSALRYLAFSHQHPKLRHPTWAPLWEASLLSNTPPSAEPYAGIGAGAKRPDEAAVDAFDIHVTLMGQDAAETLVRPCLGEVAPLLGCRACGSFRAVTTATRNTMSAALSASTKADAPSAQPAAPSPSLPPSLPVVTYWECCRVDSYIPSYVQVQAAVRHLLLRRRPTVDYTANAWSAAAAAFMSVPQSPPARPLALVAVVVPDHLTALYSEFVDMLEREGGERTQQHQQQRGATCGGPVHLLLFNSKGLAREYAVVASLPRMVTLTGCTLHIAVDADLSSNFDHLYPPHAGSNCVGVSSVAPSAEHATLFSNLLPRTQVRGVRQVNAVSQTVVLRVASGASSADSSGAIMPGSTSALTRNTYAVVVLDAQQVPPMLSAATARRCPPHLSGAGPLGWYLDAVVAGLQQAKEAEENEACSSGAESALTGKDMNSSRTDQPGTTTRTLPARRRGADGGVVHMSLIVVPNATVALSGLNSTNVNVTSTEAAALFSAAVAWSAARRVMAEVSDVEAPLADRSACGAAARRSHVVPVELDLCATAAHVQQATQMIAALGNKLLKSWPASAAAVGSTSLFASDSGEASIVDAADVRPDTQRKVIPSDFHALYTSMLTEVSSFSERKTMAAVAAFPTMCHLLEYVDSIAESAPGAQDGSDGGDGDVVVHVPGAVYSANYGEHRSWNVLNSAVIEALVTEYER